MRYIIILLVSILFSKTNINAEEKMIMKLKYGEVEIELFDDVAPNHVKRFKDLAQ